MTIYIEIFYFCLPSISQFYCHLERVNRSSVDYWHFYMCKF